MTHVERKQNHVARATPALFWLTLGAALIASSLAQEVASSGEDVSAVNRTAEALAGFQDLLPPGDATP